MELTLTVNPWMDEELMFAQQLGATHILARAVLPESRKEWDPWTLTALRNRVQKAGLNLVGLESLPSPHDQAVLGAPGQQTRIESTCQLIRNAGAAGIPLLGYDWPLPQGNWENLTSFLAQALPVAKQAGVALACRPGILSTAENLRRLAETAPGPGHGLDLCLGTGTPLPAAEQVPAIRSLVQKEKLLLATVHFSKGNSLSPSDPFLAKGDTVLLEAVQTLREAGFTGPVRPDCPPGATSDPECGPQVQAFAAGHLRALLQALCR